MTTPGHRVALPANPCTDPDGDTYTIAAVSDPSHGALSTQSGTNYYTPSAGYHGQDQFTYRATDTHAEQSDVATVQILIDTAPTCLNSSAKVQSGGALILPDPPCGDVDGDDWGLFIGDPEHGTVGISDDGFTATYTPAAGFVGADTINYRAEDPFGLSSPTRTLTITVSAPPPPDTTPPPPPDTTPPTLSFASPAARLKAAIRKGLRLMLNTNEAGRVSVTVSVDRATARKLKLNRKAKGRVTVARLQRTVTSGRSTLVVKLTAKARKALKKGHKVKLRIVVAITDAAGNTRTRTLGLTLKR